MTELEFKDRTKSFGLRVLKLVEALPESRSGRAIASQLVRSGTSVGANYRAACRGRSRADFVAKLAIAEEEADESSYWLEVISASGMLKEELVSPLHREAQELVAIIVKSRMTAQCAINSDKIKNQKSKIKN
jgi:four helix bundle protein